MKIEKGAIGDWLFPSYLSISSLPEAIRNSDRYAFPLELWPRCMQGVKFQVQAVSPWGAAIPTFGLPETSAENA
jgi:hypothetical protein